MEEIIKALKADEEIKQMREEWKKYTDECFPGFHFEIYIDIDDYKKRVRKQLDELKLNDPPKMVYRSTKWSDGAL